jgi:hypothetical protein
VNPGRKEVNCFGKPSLQMMRFLEMLIITISHFQEQAPIGPGNVV